MKSFVDLVTLSWLALLAGALWLLLKKRRTPALLLFGLAAVASLVEAAALPLRLMALLERPYLNTTAGPAQPVDAIVVCGGGSTPSDAERLGFAVNNEGNRLLTAVELARAGKARALVLGGGGRGTPPLPLESTRSKAWIEHWQLVPVPVIALPSCVNTHDEALRTAELARQKGWKSICLVTSAWHMRRARAVFEKATGLQIIPAAADFIATTSLANQDHIRLYPGTETVDGINRWLREIIGDAAYKLRGWS